MKNTFPFSKKDCLFPLLWAIHIFAFGQNDQVCYFFTKYNGDAYYLSAIEGGGDEIVTKKIAERPGQFERFQVIGIEEGFQVKSYQNHYVQIREDGTLEALEKNVDAISGVWLNLKGKDSSGKAVRKYKVDALVFKSKLSGKEQFIQFSTREKMFVAGNFDKEALKIEVVEVNEGLIETLNKMLMRMTSRKP